MQGMDMSKMAKMQGVVMMPLSQVPRLERAGLCKVALWVSTSGLVQTLWHLEG